MLTRRTTVQTERDEEAGRRGDGARTAAVGVGRDGSIPSVRRLPMVRAWSSRGRRSRRSSWRRRLALVRSEASARCGNGGRRSRRRAPLRVRVWHPGRGGEQWRREEKQGARGASYRRKGGRSEGVGGGGHGDGRPWRHSAVHCGDRDGGVFWKTPCPPFLFSSF